MGIAFASTLDDGESFTTLELKIDSCGRSGNEKLRAVGKVVSRGKTVGMTECEITNSAGAIVARSSSTCMVLRGEKKPQAAKRRCHATQSPCPQSLSL